MQVGLSAFDYIGVDVNNRGGNESINKVVWKKGLEVSVADMINSIFIVY